MKVGKLYRQLFSRVELYTNPLSLPYCDKFYTNQNQILMCLEKNIEKNFYDFKVLVDGKIYYLTYKISEYSMFFEKDFEELK